MQPSLGLPAIESLNLLSQINMASFSDNYVISYPDLFNGLGSLAVKYNMQLKENAKPVALCISKESCPPITA